MRRKARTSYSLAQEARDLFMTFRICKMSSEEIEARLKTWRETFPKRLTNHERGFVDGYVWALRDALWQDVEFVYRDANGILYSTHKGTELRSTEEFYQRGEGCLLGDMECAHVWKGSSKPYTKFSVISKAKA